MTRLTLFAATSAIALIAAPAHAESRSADAAAGLIARASYPAEDFARFAPRTAKDILDQVPGFTIRGADSSRGLGQASENVLINGQRVADKSGGALEQLQNIPASQVLRIDLLDAAQLGIAGLTGTVANVVLKAQRAGKGSYEWRPELRAHYAHPGLIGGKVSWQDKAGPVDYTLTLDNRINRGAFGEGEYELRFANGVTENRDGVLTSDFTQPRMTARAKVDMPGSSVLDASIVYGPYWAKNAWDQRVTRSDGSDRDRTIRSRRKSYEIDYNGTYDFALGKGRAKLIGLRHFEHDPSVNTVITAFDSGAPSTGNRFDRDSRQEETVLRAEYAQKAMGSDWQLSFERAFNQLEQNGRLFVLSPTGTFNEVPLPDGSGTVREVRYEGIASMSRALSPKLDLQLTAGAERSTLERVDGDLSRTFVRPKGSLSLGWRPSKGWDTNLSLKRRVGQISFYDFLAQPNLSQDRQNAGNNELVPPQSWEAELEVGRELGAWGKLRGKAYAHRIDDIIDLIPLSTGGEAIGNLPRASRRGAELNGTINFDPIGWTGAKLDLGFGYEKSRVKDPLTGEHRPISGNLHYSRSINLRHDVPKTQFAWGGFYEINRVYDTYFPSEVGNGWEGPFAGFFVEHKDVMGAKVNFQVINVTGGLHHFDRTVWTGPRNVAPVAYVEHQAEKIGPIFRLRVSGNF